MAKTIPAIIDQLVAIQGAITPPTGEKDIAFAADELPVDLHVFPTFLNVETATHNTYSPQRIEKQHLIDMILVFAPADKKYSQRSRRAWVQAVQAAFNAKVTLNGTCDKARILNIRYDTPLNWNDIPFVMATFELEAVVVEDVVFGT